MSFSAYNSHSSALKDPKTTQPALYIPEPVSPTMQNQNRTRTSRALYPIRTDTLSTRPPSYSEVIYSPPSPSVYSQGFQETPLHGDPTGQPQIPARPGSTYTPMRTVYRQEQSLQNSDSLRVPKPSHGRGRRPSLSVNTSVTSFQSQPDIKEEQVQMLPAPVTAPVKSEKKRSTRRKVCWMMLIILTVIVIALVLGIALTMVRRDS